MKSEFQCVLANYQMTYCLAIKLDQGLVFCSDSRTNAGPDQVSTYNKMHRWGVNGERQFVLLSAGNLATTQSVVTQIKRDIDENANTSLGNIRYMSDAADYVGQLNKEERHKHKAPAEEQSGFNPEATFILGGQIKNEDTMLYMIYPEGNHINVSDISPFLQVGENKYGKPILDRIIRSSTDIESAVRCALVSMDSTMRSNATVGPPINLMVYKTDSLSEGCYKSFADNDPYLQLLRKSWDEKVVSAFNEMPSLSLECPTDQSVA
jgi:putative proteasome-type protease